MDEKNNNSKEIKITLPVFNAKTVFRILAFICTFCVFMPSFLVSCSGQDVEISAFNTLTGIEMYGSQVVEPTPGALFILAAPIVTVILLFIKKFDDIKTGLYTLGCKIVELIAMVVFAILVSKKAEENYCEFSVTPLFIVHIISIILCIVLAFCIYKQLIFMTDDLFYKNTYKKIGKFLHGGLPKNNVEKDSSSQNTDNTTNSDSSNNNIVKESLVEKFNKIPNKIKIIVGVVLVSIFGLIIYFASPKTINLDNYIVFEIEGYDGYGEASAYIDWDSINNKYGKDIQYTNTAKNDAGRILSLQSASDYCEDHIVISQDKTDHLSNGDVVTVSIVGSSELEKNIKCNFKFSSKSFTVSNLQEAIKIDLLSVLEEPYVSFTGPNSRTYATPKYKKSNELVYNDDNIVISVSENYSNKYISVVSNNQQIAKMEFALSNEGPLSNGDVTTLYLTNIDDLLMNGYAPEKDNIQITVSDRPELITDVGQMSEDSIKGYIIKYIYLKNINGGYEPYSDNCYRNEVCHAAYMMKAKPSTITDYPVSIIVDFSYEYISPGYSKPWISQYDGYLIMHNVYLEGNEMATEKDDIGTYSSWYHSDIYELMDEYSSEYDFEQIF